MADGYFERGEIYWAKMGAGIGVEMNVTRPALIISSDEFNNRSDLVIVVFLSLHGEACPRYVETYATGKLSRILCNQVQSVDKARFTKLLGVLPPEDMREVEDALEEVFDLGYVDDSALKAKDREIEAREAVIAEKDSEIASLKAQLEANTSVQQSREDGYQIEIAMWQRLYEKALNQVVDMKYTNDLFLKNHLGRNQGEPPKVGTAAAVLGDPIPPKQPEPPKEPVAEPVIDERVDINHCTITALKKLGFSLPMARLIVSRRPYNAVADLKNVPGMKATQFRIMEPKLRCTKVEKKVAVVNGGIPDPGYELDEPVAEPGVESAPKKVNVNTASVEELMSIGLNAATAKEIRAWRNKNGSFVKLEDLLALKYFGKTIMKRYGHMLEV